MHKCTFSNLYICIFWYGLLMNVLETTWAKPIYMYMQCIFPCEGGMHLLIAGFASVGYLHREPGLRELSFEFECVYSL